MNIITRKTRSLYLRPPKPPFELNLDHESTRGIVAWWPLGHAGLSKSAIDASGRGWLLTTNNTPTTGAGPRNETSGRGIAAAYATNQNHEFAGAVVTAAPLTLEAWFNPNNVTGSHVLLAISDGAVGGAWFQLYAAGADAGDPLRAQAHHIGKPSETFASTTTSFLADTWQHGCATFTSATSRACYLNGGGVGTDTASATPAAMVRTMVGAFRADPTDSTYYGATNGRIADAIIRNVDLTADEAMARWNARTRWAHYWRLRQKVWSFAPPAAPAGGNRRRRVLMGAV